MSQPESPRSLLELLAAAPASRPAVVLPEAGIRVGYGSLRAQVARTAALGATGEVEIGGRAGGRSAGAPLPDDVALVLHTSGSTGRPKRVPLRHRNLAASAGTIAGTYALGEADVALCVMPLFHVHGLVASVLSTLASGGAVVVPARFNPLAFWRTAREQRVTWYSAVPTIHQLLIARSGRERPT